MNLRTATMPRAAVIFIFGIAALLPVRAQQGMCPPTNLINTHAVAHTRLSNTVADVTLGISSDGTSVAIVSKALSDRSQKLMTYLRAQHAERLATNQVSVEPKTHTVKGGPDVTVGYSGRIGVSFRTTPEKASEMITAALANGANTLDQVNFLPGEEETEAARKNLAVEATKSAVAQADAVAKAAGEHVAGVREITVDPGGSFLRPMAMMQRMTDVNGAAAPPPIATEAGDQEVSVTVNVDVMIAQ